MINESLNFINNPEIRKLEETSKIHKKDQYTYPLNSLCTSDKL